MTNETSTIQRIIYALNDDKSLNLQIKQDEHGKWLWCYWNGIDSTSEIYAHPDDALCGLIKWFRLVLGLTHALRILGVLGVLGGSINQGFWQFLRKS